MISAPATRWTPASRSLRDDYTLAAEPVFTADPMNITLVVETGDSHISVLDGDTFAVLDRSEAPFAVHGGPKFSSDGRYVFVMSPDGWLQKYDIWSLHEVGRMRAGLNSRNIALSSGGRWLALANYLPMTLTILSTADLGVAIVFDVTDRKGKPSRVSAVYQAPQRGTFVLALKDVPEIWEVAFTEDGGPYSEGLVHSNEYGMEEALGVERGLFARRRIQISAPLDDFFFSHDYRELVGAKSEGEAGVVVNLEVGREIATLPLPGMPHLGLGISCLRDGHRVVAIPNLNEGRISVIDMQDWSLIKVIETSGPGFFLRSHLGRGPLGPGPDPAGRGKGLTGQVRQALRSSDTPAPEQAALPHGGRGRTASRKARREGSAPPHRGGRALRIRLQSGLEMPEIKESFCVFISIDV